MKRRRESENEHEREKERRREVCECVCVIFRGKYKRIEDVAADVGDDVDSTSLTHFRRDRERNGRRREERERRGERNEGGEKRRDFNSDGFLSPSLSFFVSFAFSAYFRFLKSPFPKRNR